jgi:thymidylate synthase (FAD)
MRGAVYADWEIRGLALAVLEILQREAPLLFGDFTIDELPDGTRTAAPVYSKI